jgi:hypothetical protein
MNGSGAEVRVWGRIGPAGPSSGMDSLGYNPFELTGVYSVNGGTGHTAGLPSRALDPSA